MLSYWQLHGFFGGIHLAILTAYVCQRFPDAGISALLSAFFALFHGWSWPEPVILQGGLTYLRCPDGRSFMPIMMPCSPYEWCNSNITISTFSKIREEFQRGYNMTIVSFFKLVSIIVELRHTYQGACLGIRAF